MMWESNITSRVLRSQLTGKGYQCISQVPVTVSKRYQGVIGELATFLSRLDHALREGPPYNEVMLTSLKDFQQQLNSLVMLDPSMSDRDSQAECQKTEQLAILFRQEGGISRLSTLLLSYSPWLFYSGSRPVTTDSGPSATSVRVQLACLLILRQLCFADADCCTMLTTCDYLLPHCFRLLACSSLTAAACDLIECILLTKNDLAQLDTFSSLSHVLQSLDEETLSHTYRILSLAVSDLDDCENRSSLLAQRRLRLETMSVETSVSSLNRDFLVGIPGILEKILNYACKLPFQPRYSIPISEAEHWMRWIDEHIDQPRQGSETVGSFLHSVLEEVFRDDINMSAELALVNDAHSDPMNLPTSVTRRVDALYLLSLLLTGNQRAKTQEVLAKVGIGPLLSSLFEQFIFTTSRHMSDHASQCNCSPEMILKIQLLRLVHNFCSHSPYKHVLLSYSEMDELRALYRTYYPNKAEVTDPNSAHHLVYSLPLCPGGPGLLSKIIRVVQRIPATSIFRFWLCRAAESWLRSASSFGIADQLFVISRGLLQHIVGMLLEAEFQPREEEMARNPQRPAGPPREVAQSSFDLLGEMIRFNIEACRQMDLLLDRDAKVTRFLDAVHNNLVDSNMFLRSVFLTMDHCLHANESTMGVASHFFAGSKFFSRFLHLRRRVRYLALLVSSISVDTLTLENVSCLNTALIILMLANRQSVLAPCLKMLSTSKPEELTLKYRNQSEAGYKNHRCLEPRFILSSLYQLLKFWRVHYLPGDQSCVSLEKGSGIAFEEWTRTIDTLTDPDVHSPYSLLYYLPEDQSYIVRSWHIDM